MLTNTTLKRVLDFHGHVCPELALGSKFCEFVQKLLTENILLESGFSILAENTTSALDAIQVLSPARFAVTRFLPIAALKVVTSGIVCLASRNRCLDVCILACSDVVQVSERRQETTRPAWIKNKRI